jgi:TonB family protein
LFTNKHLFIIFIIISLFGCQSSNQKISVHTERLPERKVIGIYGDTLSTSNPPPDFVPYNVRPQLIKRTEKGDSINNQIPDNVFVKVWVTREGRVRQVAVLEGSQVHNISATIEAIMKWQFSPAQINGQPVDVWVWIPSQFKK